MGTGHLAIGQRCGEKKKKDSLAYSQVYSQRWLKVKLVVVPFRLGYLHELCTSSQATHGILQAQPIIAGAK